MSDHFDSRSFGASLAWGLLNNVVLRVVTVLFGFLVARILTPAEYGTYGVALAVLTAALTLNDLGTGVAALRWNRTGVEWRRLGPSVTALAAGISVSLVAVIWALAPSIADLLGDRRAEVIIRAMSLSLLIDALTTWPAIVCIRLLQQRRKMQIDIVSALVGLATTLALALADTGSWALVGGFLVSNAAGAVLYFRYFPNGLGTPDRKHMNSLIRDGSGVVSANILTYCRTTADVLIVAWAFGASTLGQYVLALLVASWPISILASALRPAFMAGFAAAQRQQQHDRLFARGLRGTLVPGAIACAFLTVMGDELVPVLYGDQWSRAAGILPVLALYAYAKLGLDLAADYLVSVGRSGSVALIQVVWTLLVIPSLILSSSIFGLTGVVIAQTALSGLFAVPATAAVLVRAGVEARALTFAVLGPFSIGLAAACALIAVDATVSGTSALLVGVLAAGLLGLGGLRVLIPEDYGLVKRGLGAILLRLVRGGESGRHR